ncbi:hypothetical protein [Undibacterium sp.]|uniref:hypothetical protein n=1 Tax=Undibacterium sp. TaxID=1914977 RepID=UPI00374DA69B
MMDVNWSIEYKLERAFSESFAVLITGPSIASNSVSSVKVQKTMRHGFGLSSWYQNENETPYPSIEIKHVEAIELYKILADARVHAFSPTVVGLDGEKHILTLQAVHNSSIFEWFMDLPKCWSELNPAIQRITDLAERCLNSVPP